jgi:uncharacterized protein (TIGR02246 family)
MSRCGLAIAAALACFGTATLGRAEMNSDKTAIKERLVRWTEAFNARNVAGVCDLFEPDLVYAVPEVRDGSRRLLCSRLSALLAKPGLQLHYDNPDIREIIVAGDIAVVRLFWTLTARAGVEQDTGTEAAIDIFKHQPDGEWSIARFISFSITPNKLLQ